MHAHASAVSMWALLGLGAYHGLNPGMGWLFAVARGMQDRSRRAVWRTLVPLAVGHGAAVAVALAVAAVIGAVIPLAAMRWVTAVALVGVGIVKLVRRRHPGWGGMKIGFAGLTFWSFLMASAHGAGLMLLPLVLPSAAAGVPATGIAATVVHTVGYLGATGLAAAIVYERLGVGFLRRGWVNVDLVWAVALVGAGFATVIF